MLDPFDALYLTSIAIEGKVHLRPERLTVSFTDVNCSPPAVVEDVYAVSSV